MSDLGLFDLPPDAYVTPAVATTADAGEKLSAGQRLTIRQRADLARGRHPLTNGPLHAEAAPHEDPNAPGRRCGNCAHRAPGRYAKCLIGPITHGPATDVRAWWPACTGHEWGDPRMGPDAARDPGSHP